MQSLSRRAGESGPRQAEAEAAVRQHWAATALATGIPGVSGWFPSPAPALVHGRQGGDAATQSEETVRGECLEVIRQKTVELTLGDKREH